MKRLVAMLMGILMMISCGCPVYAAAVPKQDTPDYKVAFYAFDCYHMQDKMERNMDTDMI